MTLAAAPGRILIAMSTDPAPVAGGRPPVGSAAQGRATAKHAELLQQLRAQSDRALAPARNLHQYIEAQFQATINRPKHKYSVFRTGTPRRFMVLRDVDELNGELPVQTSDDFASALNLSHQRMLDSVAAGPPTLNWDALMDLLQLLSRTLAEIETGNARISGTGRIDDPYTAANGALCTAAPVSLGFPGAPGGDVRLMVSDRFVAVAAPPPLP